MASGPCKHDHRLLLPFQWVFVWGRGANVLSLVRVISIEFPKSLSPKGNHTICSCVSRRSPGQASASCDGKSAKIHRTPIANLAKIFSKSIEYRSNIYRKSKENPSNIYRKSIEHRSRIYQTSVEHVSKIDRESIEHHKRIYRESIENPSSID